MLMSAYAWRHFPSLGVGTETLRTHQTIIVRLYTYSFAFLWPWNVCVCVWARERAEVNMHVNHPSTIILCFYQIHWPHILQGAKLHKHDYPNSSSLHLYNCYMSTILKILILISFPYKRSTNFKFLKFCKWFPSYYHIRQQIWQI
jgi:hypothetical protein